MTPPLDAERIFKPPPWRRCRSEQDHVVLLAWTKIAARKELQPMQSAYGVHATLAFRNQRLVGQSLHKTPRAFLAGD